MSAVFLFYSILNLIKIDVFEDIKYFSELLSIGLRKVINYPDKTRDLFIDKYLNNPDEIESFDKIKRITIENKNELIKLKRLNYIVNNDSQIQT